MSDTKRLFAARFDGWCARCHEKIYEGGWVYFDDEKNVVHDDCGGDDE